MGPLPLSRKAQRFPPLMCRLLARSNDGHNRAKAMTDEDIAKRSGLPMSEVKRISWSLSWNEIPFGSMLKFLKGCDIDFDDRFSIKNSTRMMNSGRFTYLRKHPLWEPQFKVMVAYWRTKAKDASA